MALLQTAYFVVACGLLATSLVAPVLQVRT